MPGWKTAGFVTQIVPHKEKFKQNSLIVKQVKLIAISRKGLFPLIF
jgi:hypothetical protein